MLPAIFLDPVMLTDILLKYLFRQEDEFCVMLGQVTQKGSTFAILNSKRIWQSETTKKKIRSIINLKWTPSENLLQLAARQTLMDSIFGKESDYNGGLFKINAWHNSQKWELNSLTDFDKTRSSALDGMTILIRTRHRKATSNYLNLNIADKAKEMCVLLHPMVVKIPVTSIQYYLDIHSEFAFNSIRRAKHPNADDLISYIYEVQLIQQKIAMSLHEYLCLVDYSEKQKKEALLINAEVTAIMGAELVFSYLKASIEKIIVVIGLIYGVKNLETKKTHKSKLEALVNGIPEPAKKLYYYDFIIEFIKSENIDELNNYRTGILHKKGISDLQPHNYIGEKAESVPLKKIFQVLLEQHSKNTAVLIGTYALLTDDLVSRDRPTIKSKRNTILIINAV